MDFEILAEVEALRESARVSPEYSTAGWDSTTAANQYSSGRLTLNDRHGIWSGS